MIHYQLRCSAGHGFEGWFRDAAGFDEQSARGLLSCPECATSAVTRAMMAPAVRASRRLRAAPPAPGAGPEPRTEPRTEPRAEPRTEPRTGPRTGPNPGQTSVAAPGAAAGGVAVLPDQVRAVLQRMRAEIERNCDDVGERFAQVARAEHRKAAEAPDQARRGIYGQATADEVEALADDGIAVNRIPWLPRADG
ncbi:DUF1178 family protein [Lichenicoccus sp.]|uniref:DUF1178 family protein n=1 Tax=Lichenicoccus sp. TaxID=2781899 RepID=UPI003D0F48B4